MPLIITGGERHDYHCEVWSSHHPITPENFSGVVSTWWWSHPRGRSLVETRGGLQLKHSAGCHP